ncbi:hypothetical protein C8R43DRAFT_1228909 [Mycena crocata]|nr:hypothetical protein C8R43DRAFT_1228909 [Mycena crocata]
MSDGGIVGRLTYLSGYLDETKARVRQLEEELEKKPLVKDEPDASKTRLQCLESENETLRQELAAVKASGKVKKEMADVKLEFPDVELAAVKASGKVKKEKKDVKLESPDVDLSAPNSALADSRQKRRELEQKKIQETTELAAKALREKVEGEKTLDSVRRALRELQKTNDEAVEARGVEIEGKDVAIANLRSKYNFLKAKNKTLRTSFQEHKTSYEAVITEKEELQQTLREMIEVVESLQEKVAANTDCSQLLHKVFDKCDVLEVERTKLEEKCASLEAELAGFKERDIDFDLGKSTKAIAKYRKYMKACPVPKNQPYFGELEPICYRRNNLHAYLSQDPDAKSYLNRILYLPKRTMHMADFHFVAFGATHRYDQAMKKWIEGSDLTSVHGETRELFMDRREFLCYVGTYKCHDLRKLHPEGSDSPDYISFPEIADAALGVPWPAGYIKIIKECYPDGIIKVEAVGLQCIGFNVQLYDSLRRRFAKDRKGRDHAMEGHATEGKRKAEDEINQVGKKQKS